MVNPHYNTYCHHHGMVLPIALPWVFTYRLGEEGDEEDAEDEAAEEAAPEEEEEAILERDAMGVDQPYSSIINSIIDISHISHTHTYIYIYTYIMQSQY